MCHARSAPRSRLEGGVEDLNDRPSDGIPRALSDDTMTRHLFLMLIVGVLLSGCMRTAAQVQVHPFDDDLFERYEVVTGISARQSVLTGFLLGSAHAELAVVNLDETQGRSLRVYAFADGAWVLNLEATLRPDVLFVDVARIGGRDRLISYEPGRLNWFDPESETERSLVMVTSNFNPPRSGGVPHVDVTRDVNDDNRDDLVVPDVDGFWVFVQINDGGFADPVKIGPPTQMSRILGADGYRYDPWSQSRVHEMDYAQDGRDDLVFWNEDHFEVHTQDERGRFATVAKTFSTDVAFDFDDPSSLSTGDMRGKLMHSLADLNDDGVADLMVYSLEGTRDSRKRSSYGVYFGAPTPDGGTAFAADVGAVFQSEDSIQFAIDRHDFDRDGHVDLMFTSIERRFLGNSLWKRLKGLMGDDVWLRLEFYRSEDGLHPDTPDATRRIALDGVPSPSEPGWVPLGIVLRGGTHERRNTQESYPRAFNNTLLVGDVTGDGRLDLLVGDHPRILDVFVGVPGQGLFAQEPHNVEIAITNDEEYTWLVDLNQDGKQDILMHHPFTLRDGHGAPTEQPGTEPHRVTMLIAR